MSHSNDSNQLYQLLKQATCAEFPPVLTSATIIFGIGTTGSKIVINLFRLLEASERGVPDGVIFIVADVDSDERDDTLAEISQIVFIPLGKSAPELTRRTVAESLRSITNQSSQRSRSRW